VRRALALIAGTALLLTTGCGHSSSSERPAVARYVTRVNRIEAKLAAPLASITSIGAQFARAQGVGGGSLSGFVEQSTMSTALRRIAALRRQLAAVRAPSPAAKLRDLLLEVIDAELRAARQLQKLVVFLPRFNAALAPLGADIARLETVLSRQSAYGAAAVAAVYAEKAAALRRFQSSLEAVLAKLRRLDPPAVSKPDYAAQVHALTGMSSNAGKLASALARDPQGSDVPPLLVAFDRAAASAQSASAQKAHRSAVRSYNAQLARINRLSQDAEAERTRLAATLQ
jgi:hypothetical protein